MVATESEIRNFRAGVRRMGLAVALAHGGACALGGCLSTPAAVDGGGGGEDARDAHDAGDASDASGCVGDPVGSGFVGGELTDLVRDQNALVLEGLAESGFYVSATFDAGATRAWRTLSWTPGKPSFKPLPGGGATETGYLDGNADMSDNLLLLHLDEDGAVLDDASSQQLTASCAGAGCPATTAGIFGGGRLFDGVDDIIVIPEGPEIEPPSFTLEAWGRADADPDPPGCGGCTLMFAGKGRSPGPPYTSYSIEYDPATDLLKCYVGLEGGMTLESTATYAPGARVHVACSYDGEQVRFFVDGEAVREQPATGSIDYDHDTTDALVIGGWGVADNSFGQRFEGMIDEVALWSRALDAEEIRDHADRGYQLVQLQVRTCDDAPCVGPFVGPDGTDETFYTETCGAAIAGPPSLTLAELDCDGDGAPDDPLGDPVAPGRYLQYRVQLDSLRPPRTVAIYGVTVCE